MIAYFCTAPAEAFWEAHWKGHSVEELLRVARRSPLTGLIEAALPRGGRILEAGCGLGQYVVLLRERGHRAVGVDRTFGALRECRQGWPAAPLAVMDLRSLGFHPGSIAGYISLGVVEHDPQGPDAILREAWGVLEPGGVLILSVPYINGVRRVGAWWIRRRNRQVQEAGGAFYQFAFSRREARTFLARNSFRVLASRPYDPARLIRSWGRRLVGLEAQWQSPRPGAQPVQGTGAPGRLGPMARLAHRLLYMRPALSLFGHMILFVAVKAE